MYDKKNENPGDIQEIFNMKKSRRWDQKSKRYPGYFQEMATLLLYHIKQLTDGGHEEICDKNLGHDTKMVGNHWHKTIYFPRYTQTVILKYTIHSLEGN